MPSTRSPFLISVVGTSRSGKTATIEYLTQSLTRLGWRVGVAKHIHREGFTIDTEGKDTWKHARAGAKLVIGASPNELAIIKKTSSETNFQEISEVLRGQNLDISLLEGFSTALATRAKIPKIIAAKDKRDLKHTVARARPPILAITGPVTKDAKKIRELAAPILDLKREGPVLVSMVRRLVRPKELEQLFKEASLRHGGKCIGLAIGVRAAYIATSAFGHNPLGPQSISCGTKHCIADAFKTIYPNCRVQTEENRNDRILLESRDAALVIQLARKRKFSGIGEVLNVPDKMLFDLVNFSPRSSTPKL